MARKIKLKSHHHMMVFLSEMGVSISISDAGRISAPPTFRENPCNGRCSKYKCKKCGLSRALKIRVRMKSPLRLSPTASFCFNLFMPESMEYEIFIDRCDDHAYLFDLIASQLYIVGCGVEDEEISLESAGLADIALGPNGLTARDLGMEYEIISQDLYDRFERDMRKNRGGYGFKSKNVKDSLFLRELMDMMGLISAHQDKMRQLRGYLSQEFIFSRSPIVRIAYALYERDGEDHWMSHIVDSVGVPYQSFSFERASDLLEVAMKQDWPQHSSDKWLYGELKRLSSLG